METVIRCRWPGSALFANYLLRVSQLQWVKFMIFFLFFPENRIWNSKRQILFSGKNKKNISKFGNVSKEASFEHSVTYSFSDYDNDSFLVIILHNYIFFPTAHTMHVVFINVYVSNITKHLLNNQFNWSYVAHMEVLARYWKLLYTQNLPCTEYNEICVQ